MQVIAALTLKDLRLLLRDKPGFFFTFGFPILYALFFGMIFSGATGGDGRDGAAAIGIVVVDLDDTEGSRAFVQTLSGSEELSVTVTDTVEAANEAVRTGRRTASVVITEGFGPAGDRMFWGDPARLEVGVDPSRTAEAGMLQGILTKYAFQRMQTMFGDPSEMRRRALDAIDAVDADETMPAGVRGPLRAFLQSLDGFADGLEAAGSETEDAEDAETAMAGDWQPVEVVVTRVTGRKTSGGPTSSFAISFPQAIVWGVMACAAAFGISMVVERTRGTLVRLRVAPVTRRQILLGKSGACFLTVIVVIITLLVLAAFLGVRPGLAAVPKIAMSMVSIAIGFVGIMMLLSVLGKTEAAAGGIGWGVLIVMAMLGGGMIPLFVMPSWMQSIASISPIKWAILSMEGAIWRGYSYGEMLLPCGILVGVGVAGFVGGSAAFRWSDGGPSTA